MDFIGIIRKTQNQNKQKITNIKIVQKMGQQICRAEKLVLQDPLGYNFGTDDRQPSIDHTSQIICSNKQVQKILDNYTINLKNDRKLFKDPTMSSEPIILKSLSENQKETRCTYERPSKFLSNISHDRSYKLINIHDSQASHIEVKDQIMQYFGVFLCFLANKPNEIAKIITTKQNTYGMHAIEAYRSGKAISFIIDDYVLCRQDKDRNAVLPMFTQPQKGIYMWPCILQKAWYKLKYSSQQKLSQNTPQQVFQAFLPLPLQKFQLKDSINQSSKQTLNKYFQSYFSTGYPKDKGYILKSKKNPEHDIGLSGSRYFYLLDSFLFQNKRMFYIRNPYTAMEFRGMYSIIEGKLEGVLCQRGYLERSLGNFVVDQEEFIQQIGEVLVVHYIPGNKISSYCFQCETQQQFYLGFDLKQKGTFNLSIVQNIQQSFGVPKSKSSSTLQSHPKYYPFIYHVIRLSDGKLIGGNDNKEGCFGVKNTYLLDNFNEVAVPGKYLIRLKKKYQYISNLQLYMIVSSLQEIKFQIANQQQMDQKWKQFLKTQGARQLSLNSNKIKKSKDIDHVVCWLGDIAYVYIENKSKTNEISIQVNFPQLMNLHCISHPEIRRSDEWHTYKLSDKFLIIFEKISLTAETHIRQYHIEAF